MASFGEEIKRERELRGISLREISDATKINMRFLEALENNDFEHLPGGQFNKGFIRAYASYIGIDPEKIVNSYLLELSKQEESKKPFTPLIPSVEKRKSKKWLLPFLIAVMVIIIILIVVVFFVWRSDEEEQGGIQEGVSEIIGKTEQESTEEKMEKRFENNLEEGSASNQPSHEVQQISLTVKVRKRGKIHARCNGDELLNRTLSRGDRRTLECDKELTLSLSNREAFQIFYKDQELRLPEEPGRAINNFIITKDNLEALIHGNQQ
jgi:cytoskeletal protein RodZ